MTEAQRGLSYVILLFTTGHTLELLIRAIKILTLKGFWCLLGH